MSQAIEKAEQQLPTDLQVYARIISEAAANPAVDVDKLQKLMDMHDRVLDRSAEMAFNAAMTKAQSEMKQVAAKAVNPQTHSKYAKYEALDKMVRPIYTANGFALSFNTGDNAPAEHIRVLCDVSHSGGFSKQFKVDMPADGKGAKGGDVMTKTHAAGAAFSYGARYLLKMIWNIAIGEDDKDGNTTYKAINEKQVADLRALAEEVKADIPKFCQYYKIDKIENLPASLYQSAVKAFEKKRRQA